MPELQAAFADAVTETFDFDESKHPRDAHGRFGPGDGTADTADAPVDVSAATHWSESAALTDALDKVPPGTPVWVNGAGIDTALSSTDPKWRYTAGPSLVTRAASGVTILREVPAEWSDRAHADPAGYMATVHDAVMGVHETLVEAVGDRDLAARLSNSYALVNRDSPGDKFLQLLWQDPTFKADATASRGDVTIYHNGYPAVALVLHEAGHNVDSTLGSLTRNGDWNNTQVDDWRSYQAFAAQHGGGAVWQQPAGGEHEVTPGGFAGQPSVTTYGSHNPSEDYAESFRLWAQDRRGRSLGVTMDDGTTPRFADLFPARAAQLDTAIAQLRTTHTKASTALTRWAAGGSVGAMEPRTDVMFFDAKGAPVAPGDPAAVGAEITTYDKDGNPTRTYASKAPQA